MGVGVFWKFLVDGSLKDPPLPPGKERALRPREHLFTDPGRTENLDHVCSRATRDGTGFEVQAVKWWPTAEQLQPLGVRHFEGFEPALKATQEVFCHILPLGCRPPPPGVRL